MKLSPASRIAVAIALVLALLPGGLWMGRNALVAARWSALERETARLLAEARGRSGLRPVPRGAPQPGKAWEKYDEAIRLLGGYSPRGSSKFMPDSPEWTAAELKVLAPALPAFGQGVSRGNGQRDRDWEGPESPVSTDIVCLGRVRAGALEDDGKPLEAARWLLDLIQFCGDYARNGSSEDVAEANQRRGTLMEDLQKLLLTGKLRPPDCAELAKELERADLAFPSLRDALLNSAMSQGCMYLDLAPKGRLLRKGGPPSWRHLYSEQALISAAFFTELDALRRIGDAEGLPWPEARAIEIRMLEGLSSDGNPHLNRYAGRRNDVYLRPDREQRAQLRLLRAAARYRAAGLFESIEDPFGTTLRHQEKDGKVKFWSVGADGVDNGGQGGWKPDSGPDRVLELGVRRPPEAPAGRTVPGETVQPGKPGRTPEEETAFEEAERLIALENWGEFYKDRECRHHNPFELADLILRRLMVHAGLSRDQCTLVQSLLKKEHDEAAREILKNNGSAALENERALSSSPGQFEGLVGPARQELLRGLVATLEDVRRRGDAAFA
ncbi:MAG: hypothetical protein HY293_18675, partial [Planctomycetes bacterium]|nr:hypothetical protein [Planctomycetota bacterium]